MLYILSFTLALLYTSQRKKQKLLEALRNTNREIVYNWKSMGKSMDMDLFIDYHRTNLYRS